MACTGRFATAQEYIDWWRVSQDLTAVFDPILGTTWQVAVEQDLDLAAGQIHANMAASGQCDCTLAGWADEYLKQLNIVGAAVAMYPSCKPPGLDEDTRPVLMEQYREELALIRTGELELCDGETGLDYPAIGFANMAWTEFNAEKIIRNTHAREDG